MKLGTILLFLVSFSWSLQGQKLYVQTFGEKGATPLVFLHGGPGYNAATFEFSTAQALADKGFFVVVYDRRGEGRSTDEKAKFTFEESLKDLNKICKSLKLKKVHLLGHSFGGMVAIKFAKKYPKKMNSITLIGAPLDLQATFKTIIASSKEIYTKNEDGSNLAYIQMLEEMDTSLLTYANYCFLHAMQNGFYSPKRPNEKTMTIYKNASKNPVFVEYASKMTQNPVKGFWSNEEYTTMNLSQDLQDFKTNGLPCFGLYGQEDGLFSPQQVEHIQNIIGTKNVEYLENCSHSVFIDRQDKFIQSLLNWTK
ncbi:MAG: alpha/beta hydrolase [Aureispira sp.]|nr:alpha/beta hydrolase [Aureispira sp.]